MPVGKYQRTPEHNARISAALKQSAAMKACHERQIGTKRSPATCEKIAASKRGKKYSEEYRKALSDGHKGKRLPQQSGESHWNWKGGISPLVRVVRDDFKYRQWRDDVFKRDDYTCVMCGVRGGTLHADHYPKLFSDIMAEYNIRTLEDAVNCAELWSINNGRTLCRACHYKRHSGEGSRSAQKEV